MVRHTRTNLETGGFRPGQVSGTGKAFRPTRRARWAPLVLVAIGLLVAGAASGHGIKPRFDQVWQRIRYHDTFHDGHGHDGYGHGFHMSNSGHIHDDNGMATRPPWPPEIIRYGPGPADPPPARTVPQQAPPMPGPRPVTPPPSPANALDLDILVVNDLDLGILPIAVEMMDLPADLSGPPDVMFR
ncbi:MAG: hypothetical protein HYY01_00980 [Chloroflexi bacterium]|nr:hypothetical protein [Chloroflexota bacterium]